MNKLLLILVTCLSGCASGVVTIERPIPANMLRTFPETLPDAEFKPNATIAEKMEAILKNAAMKGNVRRECIDNNNALVRYLGEK